ncbi:MAG: PAS domain-containing hybrid sensor histidine kinase/response regulator, partial [Thermoanaerobaculia bacterium]
DVNDRLCEMLGYERSELLHKSWADLTHPEDLDAEMPYYRALMSGQSDGYTIDKRFIRRDGTIVYAAISVGCVRRADRSIDHVVGLVQDLTERKVAENELFRREEEFKALVENSPDVVMRFSRDHRHLYVSPVIERFTGIPASQFIGKTHRELGMPEEICRLFETALTEVFAIGEERTVAFTFTGPEGEHFFQDRIVPEFDAAHEVEFALSVTRDITAIHNSEGRFRESEALLATAQRMAHIGSWEMNLETGQRTWSREVFRIMGLPAGDPPPENEVISAIHDADRPAVIRAHEMAIETGEMQRNEHRMTTADGSEHIFSILIEPGRDAEGRTVKLTGTVQDVTALRQAEHSLRQSEQRMRDLIESANDAIITLDGTGKILEVNPAVVRLMHEPAEAIIGRQITYSIHPDHVADVLSGLSTVIATGGIAQIEAPVLTALGNYVQVQASASRQSRKGADAIFVIGRDVTEQRRAESERQALTRQIELLLESTYEGICSADLQGRCTLVNRAAAAMLGYTPAELLGKNLHDLIHHHRADSTPYAVSDCPMTIAAKNGKPARVVNDAFWRRNGTSFPVEIFLSPILDPNGATVGIVASFIDVSERQFLQTELERANRLAGLGRVAATMSHEFNNVLMGIQPFAELLTRSSKEPRVIDAAKRISQSVQRGRRVTEELRGFTRPMEPVRRAVDAHAWLRDCAAEVRRLLPPNVELQIEVAKTPMFIEADRDQITQTVTNIVINARDAIGAAQGRITLAAKFALPGQHFSFGTLPGDERFVHFSMCDDGPGIPAENLARVIEPFFTTKKNGTGLGLAITHQIITLHGGHMFVESKVGSGTVVHLFLPATSLQEEVVGPATAPSDHLRILPSEILLIEDEEAVAAGLSFLLNDEGLKVLIAADGAGAMRVLATEKPQALVVDISLPDCDGFELYERIIAKFGPMPAVFSSGHADHVKLADLGPDADVRLLTKPYDVAALLDELELVCAAAERRKESMLLNAAAM